MDMSQVKLPFFNIDDQNATGFPAQVNEILEKIKQADAILISLAEHNGSYTAIFKSMIDWLSRVEMKFWSNKPMLLLATSPGGNGGATVLKTAKHAFPYLGANVVADFSLPKFYDNFKEGVLEASFKQKLEEQISLLTAEI
jgi:NAD(P)H-dependent FMN reductase